MKNQEHELKRMLEKHYDLEGESFFRLLTMLESDNLYKRRYTQNIREIWYCIETGKDYTSYIKNLIEFLKKEEEN